MDPRSTTTTTAAVEGGLNPETAEQWQDLGEHTEALEAQAPKIQAETLPGISQCLSLTFRHPRFAKL